MWSQRRTAAPGCETKSRFADHGAWEDPYAIADKGAADAAVRTDRCASAYLYPWPDRRVRSYPDMSANGGASSDDNARLKHG